MWDWSIRLDDPKNKGFLKSLSHIVGYGEINLFWTNNDDCQVNFSNYTGQPETPWQVQNWNSDTASMYTKVFVGCVCVSYCAVMLDTRPLQSNSDAVEKDENQNHMVEHFVGDHTLAPDTESKCEESQIYSGNRPNKRRRHESLT